MHGFDPGHAGRIGKIITNPGIVMPVEDDNTVVAFGARGEYSVALLTTDNDVFEMKIKERKNVVQTHIDRYGVSPMFFISEMNKSINQGEAIAESVYHAVYIDAGTELFSDDKFSIDVVTNTPTWRTIESPTLESFSLKDEAGGGDEYIIKQLPSIVSALNTKNKVNIRREVIDQRKRLVIDAFSVLSAISAQIMHITDGSLTYIPEGHCVYVAMRKKSSTVHEVCLIINDPVGSGWRLMDERFRDTFRATSTRPELITSRVEMLVEFSSKCVADALLKMGSDSNSTLNIVNNMKFPVSPITSSNGHMPGSSQRFTVLTSGNSTTSGLGSLTLITEDGSSHRQLALSEFRVGLSIPGDDNDNGRLNNISFSVEPRIRGEEGITSPSILKWLPAFSTTTEQPSPEGQKEVLRQQQNQEWASVPVYPAPLIKKWRACKIDDQFGGRGENAWKSKLVKLHKFDWSSKLRSDGNGTNKPLPVYAPRTFERIAMVLNMIGYKKIHDMCFSQNYAPAIECKKDTNLINAAAAMTDFFGFVEERPIVHVKKEKNEFGEGDKEKYITTIVGNSPDGTSARVVRLEKEKNFSTSARDKDKAKGYLQYDHGECPQEEPTCKWAGVSPSTLVSYDTPACDSINRRHINASSEEDFIVSSMTYTPRCIFHTSNSYVHLYSDSEGPIDHASFNKITKKLQIGPERAMNEAEDVFSYIDRPIVVAALASEEAVLVNGTVTAIPLGKKLSTTTKDKEVLGVVREQGTRHDTSKWRRLDLEYAKYDDGGEDEEEKPPSSKKLLASDTVSTIKLVMYVMANEEDTPPEEDKHTECALTPGNEIIVEQVCEPSSHYACPAEAMILQYGLNNNNGSRKRRIDVSTSHVTTSGSQQLRKLTTITRFLSMAL